MNCETIKFGAYNLHIIKTDKFKTIKVSVYFSSEVKKEEITIRNLLKMVLLNSTKNYKDENKLIKETENLYDLKLSSTSERIGNCSILNFVLEFLNEKYTEESMNKESLDFLMEILFNPNVKNKSFDKKSVDKCKNILRKSIMTEKDNKTQYSILKLLENMGDYPYSYKTNGYLEDLEKIDGKSLYEYYKKVIESNLVDIIVVGDISSLSLKKYFKDNFKVNTYKNKKMDILLKNITPNKKVNVIKEKDIVNQTKISFGFRINNMTDYERKYVLRVYNEILGGSTGNSMLFNNVREKNSLAYYINAVPKNYDNILIVYSGINKDKTDMAIKIIKNTFKEVEKGRIDEKLFKSCINSIISAIKVNEDTNQGIINSTYAKILVSASDIEEKIKNYEKITINDIVTLSKKVKMDTIFMLEGDNFEKN